MDAKARRIEEQASLLREVKRRGRQGEAALERLRLAYERRVIRVCTWDYGLAEADGEEVLSDAFLRVFQHAHEYLEGSDPEPWIWKIVRNLATDALRKGWHRLRVDTGDDPEALPRLFDAWQVHDPDAPAPQAADACLDAGLQAFERDNAEGARLLRLRHLLDHSIDEVAQLLGRTRTATETLLSKLRRQARPFVAHCHELLPD